MDIAMDAGIETFVFDITHYLTQGIIISTKNHLYAPTIFIKRCKENGDTEYTADFPLSTVLYHKLFHDSPNIRNYMDALYIYGYTNSGEKSAFADVSDNNAVIAFCAGRDHYLRHKEKTVKQPRYAQEEYWKQLNKPDSELLAAGESLYNNAKAYMDGFKSGLIEDEQTRDSQAMRDGFCQPFRYHKHALNIRAILKANTLQDDIHIYVYNDSDIIDSNRTLDNFYFHYAPFERIQVTSDDTSKDIAARIMKSMGLEISEKPSFIPCM